MTALDMRVAGEWTKRDGYSFNAITNAAHRWPRSVVEPRHARLEADSKICRPTLVWEHFSGRRRPHAHGQAALQNGADSRQRRMALPSAASRASIWRYLRCRAIISARDVCRHRSIRRMRSRCRTDIRLPIIRALDSCRRADSHRTSISMPARRNREICASSNRRSIRSTRRRTIRLELNADYPVTPALTFTSQTGYNQDFLWSTEDYNRFNTAPGAFDIDDTADTSQANT